MNGPNGRIVHPIQAAWLILRQHGEACEQCGPLVTILEQVPESPRGYDAEVNPLLCEDGRELHGAWVAAKEEWLESTRDYRRTLGVLGASQEAVILRDRAWTRLSDPERRRYLAMTAAERERLLESIEAGILAERGRVADHRVSTVPAERPWATNGRGERRCEGCGRPHTGGGRFCSRECRTAKLEGTALDE